MSKKRFKRLIEQKHRELIQEMACTHKKSNDSTSSVKKKEPNDKPQDSNDKKVKYSKPGKASKNKRPQAKHSTQKRKYEYRREIRQDS